MNLLRDMNLRDICSHCAREDDSKWPEKNKDGRQELEIRLGNEHISFEVSMPNTFEIDSWSLIYYRRLLRLAPLSMSQNQQIRKACVSSTTWCKI